MLSCKKATELIEKKDLVGLDPIQNIQLSVHIMLCKACKDYKQQSIFLDKMISKQMKKNAQLPDKDIQPGPELKKHIRELIEKRNK